jgi:hypothetical protein
MSRASSAFRMASCAALVAALGSCGGQGDAPKAESPEGPIAYGQHTDGRGWAVREEGLFGHRRVLDLPNSPESAPRGQNLGVLGYAQGSENAPATTGVLVRQTARMAPGLNLMNSGDAAEAVLMDSEGTVKHAWRLPYDDIPDAPPLATSFQIPWRRVHMRPDGSLLAMHSDAALVYVDRKSKLRWTLFDRVHHDLDVLEGPGGPTIFALARRERIVPEVNPDQPVIDDLIIRVNARGEKTLTVSLWDAFTSSEWARELARDSRRARSGSLQEPRGQGWQRAGLHAQPGPRRRHRPGGVEDGLGNVRPRSSPLAWRPRPHAHRSRRDPHLRQPRGRRRQLAPGRP